jgi:hypothetical protein
MNIKTKQILKTLNPKRIWIPIAIGLGFVGFMIFNDPDVSLKDFQLITEAGGIYLLFVFLIILLRDAGYVYRIRTLTQKSLDWWPSVYVIMLWEFASAVTPSVVGGTAVAVFILVKEKIKFGKSLAYVMLSAILDNAFFIIAAPLVLLLTAGDIFPNGDVIEETLGNSLQVLFYISYGLILLYTSIMSYALLVKPRAFKWVLLRITSWKPLRKWKHQADEQGNEMILASAQLVNRGAGYWLRIIAATIVIWVSRYAMLNVLIMAFVEVNIAEQMTIFSRQIVMWITMLISPTPGSSGTAEYFFAQFFREFLGDYTIVSSVFWRMLSYYPYLILGAIFLPKWIRRVFFANKETGEEKQEDARAA